MNLTAFILWSEAQLTPGVGVGEGEVSSERVATLTFTTLDTLELIINQTYTSLDCGRKQYF